MSAPSEEPQGRLDLSAGASGGRRFGLHFFLLLDFFFLTAIAFGHRVIATQVYRPLTSRLMVDDRICKGDIPYIQLGGRRNLFKICGVDAALKRRYQMNSLW